MRRFLRRVLTFFGASLVAVGLAFGVSTLDASEARSAKYSQVVDNATKGRFDAPGWGTSSYSPTRYGKNYHFATPSRKGKPARYKVRTPEKGRYTVFARWASNGGYNSRARYGVATTSGMEWKAVNQRANGGRWVKLGVYGMRAGDRHSVQVSRATRGEGYIIADAVKVVRGDAAANRPTKPGGQVTGTEVLSEARTWLGVPYSYGGTTRQGVDCSGFTYAVFGSLGIQLQRTAAAQYSSAPGTRVSNGSRQRGHLIFGNTGGQSGVQHVGLLVGNGDMIHAPYPGTVVRQEYVGSWYNVIGVKRIVPA